MTLQFNDPERDLATAVRALLIRTLKLESASQLPENLNVDAVAEWDSIGHLEVIQAIESQFRIQLPFTETLAMLSEGAIVTVLKKHL